MPVGSRITDYLSLGVIAKFFPVQKVREVLRQTKRASLRERDLPAHVVVYWVIAPALYRQVSYREVLRCLWEGIQWLLGPGAVIKVASKGGISRARTRLGWEAVKRLHDEVVAPLAVKATRGRGTGSGVWRAWTAAPWRWPRRKRTRQFCGFQLWNQARSTGADLLWRVKRNRRLSCEKRLPDGSCLSRIYPSAGDGRHKTNGVFYGLLMAHFAIRGLRHEAALQAGQDPERLSFLHAVRVVRRRLAHFSAIPPQRRKMFPTESRKIR